MNEPSTQQRRHEAILKDRMQALAMQGKPIADAYTAKPVHKKRFAFPRE